MKTKHLLGLAALLLAGCSTDPQELDYIAPQGAPQIKIEGVIEQDYLSRVDSNGFCDGDQIGLYGVNYTADNAVAGTLLDSGNQVDNALYTYDIANNAWISSGSIYYKDAQTNIDLYAYYPYAHPESVNNYLFEVERDQSGETEIDGFAQSDFLWGKVENVAPSDSKIKLRFAHKLASVNVVLAEGTGFAAGEFDALSKSVMVANTTRKAIIDLSTGAVTATGEVEREGIAMKATESGFRAVVVPQTISAGTYLFYITIDGINYRYKYSKGDITYQQALQTNFTININKKSASGNYELTLGGFEITDWTADIDTYGGEARQYFVVHQDEPGTLGAKIRATKKNPNKIKNLKISGKIDDRDFQFMRDSMEILQAINLKESEMVEGWYYNVRFSGDSDYTKVYFEGQLPDTNEGRKNPVLERFPNRNIDSWGGVYTTGKAHEIPDNAFNGKISLVYFSFPEKVTKIGGSAFGGTLLSGALIIPNDVVEIGGSAFSGTNITSLSLPHGLKVLGDRVFEDCKSLSGTLSLPESLECIGNRCFIHCSMLSGNLVLPSKISIIEDYCFSNCSGFTGDLVIPDGVREIYSGAFNGCEGFKGSLTLPKGLKQFSSNNGIFFGCNFQGELIIPSQIQAIPYDCFYGCDFSSVVFDKDSELIKIAEGAFMGNTRLCEPLTIPEGVITIESSAFSGCGNLPSVILPKSLTVIGSSAFNNCTNLSSITCKATTPPICGTGAWHGVAKDNFTVEVPEQSVVKYQTENGWSDFRRIAAHYDFSLSRPLLRTLNAEHSATYVMRAPAGYAWSIESAPEWVTVTPSSGVGKADVTITVNEMVAGEVGEFETLRDGATFASPSYTKHAGRKGEIVFKFDDKDYRTTMTVEQFDYEYGDGDVIVNQTATVGDGVNIVFMGDCFDAKDIADGSYLAGIEEAIGYYFAIEPYKSYKDYFNVYTVVGMSPDTGMGTVNTIKEAKFGSMYSLEGIAPDTKTTYEYAMKIDGIDEEDLSTTLVVMVENTEDYGGICYMWGDGSAIAICPMSRDAYPYDFRGIVQHEAGGHGFAKLGDEYIYHNAFIQTCTCTCCDHLLQFNAAKALGWYRNLSTNADRKTVEWAHFIYHPDYSNIVDIYEGGYFHTRGIYRCEGNSCMNNNVPYYSAISRQEMVERIMRYAGEQFDIEAFYAADVVDASNNDFVTTAVQAAAEPTLANMSSAAKQMTPKFMGDSPILK